MELIIYHLFTFFSLLCAPFVFISTLYIYLYEIWVNINSRLTKKKAVYKSLTKITWLKRKKNSHKKKIRQYKIYEHYRILSCTGVWVYRAPVVVAYLYSRKKARDLELFNVFVRIIPKLAACEEKKNIFIILLFKREF